MSEYRGVRIQAVEMAAQFVNVLMRGKVKESDAERVVSEASGMYADEGKREAFAVTFREALALRLADLAAEQAEKAAKERLSATAKELENG